jgi:hypothetical protein
VDEHSALKLYENAEHLRHHLVNAPLAERVAARRHVRSFVAAARARRNEALQGIDEREVKAADAAIAKAHAVLEAAHAAKRAAIAKLDQVEQDFSPAALLEMRLADHPDPQADALATGVAA